MGSFFFVLAVLLLVVALVAELSSFEPLVRSVLVVKLFDDDVELDDEFDILFTLINCQMNGLGYNLYALKIETKMIVRN